MARTVLILTWLLILGNPVAQAETSASAKPETVIFAGTVVDVRAGQLLQNVVIRISQGKIHSVRHGQKDSIAGEFIDLSEFTLLPGLIDVHTHLCDNSWMGEDFDHWAYPAATYGIVGAENARTTLHAGFTTVRDLSAPFYCDVAVRDAIAGGWIPGPRVFASGAMISITGGHGTWGNWIAHQHTVVTDAHVQADGEDEVRKAVRKHIRNKVDVIKVAATGGFGTHGTIPGAASYSVEELSVIVEEARKNGLSVAAHAHGADGIRNAVSAGATSIEHASMIDQEGIKLMLKSDTYAVIDLLAAHYDLIERNLDFSDKELGGSNSEEYESLKQVFRTVHESGVKIAFGTDSGIYPHGRNAEQFQLMVDAGMSPVEAIRSATIIAADLLGEKEKIGEIVTGKQADLIAVAGNPLEDIRVLEDVRFVMQSGTVVPVEKP